jgi:hypothetical protein
VIDQDDRLCTASDIKSSERVSEVFQCFARRLKQRQLGSVKGQREGACYQ